MSSAEAIKNKPFSKTEMTLTGSENFSTMRKDVLPFGCTPYVLTPITFVYFWKFARILYSK